MSGLSSVVVMVAAGYVRARVVCCRLCVLWMNVGARACVALLPRVACSWGMWMCCDVQECVGCACGVLWVEAMLWREVVCDIG